MSPTFLNNLCIGDLAELLGGQLHLGAMPPLGGPHEPVQRLALDINQVQEGDVFWALDADAGNARHLAEFAFAQGAAGVVACGRSVEPWAGRFSLQVANAHVALWELAQHARASFQGRVILIAGHEGETLPVSVWTHRVLAGSYRGCLHGTPREEDQLPLSLLEWPLNEDYAVLPLSFEKKNQFEANSHLCSPDIVVITGSHKGTGSPTLFQTVSSTLLSSNDRDRCLVLDGSGDSEISGSNVVLTSEPAWPAYRAVPQAERSAVRVATTVGRLWGIREENLQALVEGHGAAFEAP